jgi:hypothetical protein
MESGPNEEPPDWKAHTDLMNHMGRRHGRGSPAMWQAKLPVEERIGAVKRAHHYEHEQYKKAPHVFNEKHDEDDRS